MKRYDSNKILISQHIPKAGGVAFEKVLKKWFGFGLFHHYYNHKNSSKPKRPRFIGIANKILPVCIHGHFDKEKEGIGIFDLYPETDQMITILRDPLELQLSMYFYMRKLISQKALYWKGEQVTEMKYGGDIDAWVEQRPAYMLRFLPEGISLDNYKEVLNNHFIHIGVTERLQKSVEILAEKLNKPNVNLTVENTTQRTIEPSTKAVEIFKEKHTLEYLIYNYALSLNSSEEG